MDSIFLPQDKRGFLSLPMMRKVIELFEILTHTDVNIRQFGQWCGVYCLVQLHFNSV